MKRMNKVIDMLPLMKEEYKGGSYFKGEKLCECGCGIPLEDMKNSDYYDYENNLEEE